MGIHHTTSQRILGQSSVNEDFGTIIKGFKTN